MADLLHHPGALPELAAPCGIRLDDEMSRRHIVPSIDVPFFGWLDDYSARWTVTVAARIPLEEPTFHDDREHAALMEVGGDLVARREGGIGYPEAAQVDLPDTWCAVDDVDGSYRVRHSQLRETPSLDDSDGFATGARP